MITSAKVAEVGVTRDNKDQSQDKGIADFNAKVNRMHLTPARGHFPFVGSILNPAEAHQSYPSYFPV